MTTNALAIVGMACRYPDARSPHELWQNVLAQRRAFRRIPRERLDPDDYLSSDRQDLDSVYVAQAAVLEGWSFDRERFRIAGSTYRQVDLAHWLALEVAAESLADAGFSEGAGLPRESTAVVVGNTLTGEFSRANVLRLRWPYVRRVADAALRERGASDAERRAFLADLEALFKKPFPTMGEESLAGGLSNTIAGRVCNYFDLKGGGWTVDGACASSLLAVANACTLLAAGDLDVAVAGGVDLSLDPFELVGFARTGALAPELMRIYDARSAGFWPGEGCGFVVLMRHDQALAEGRRVYATVRGWGVASDGSGGITRPEAEGQLLAVRRAYRRAGLDAGSVLYLEGHGTGTQVGDAVELEVLSRARRESPHGNEPAHIGSVKANIGHTKAAAGVAGLIKATLALHHQIVPPTTGCIDPHPLVSGDDAALRIARDGIAWPSDRPLRAGVSAMGFGGIDTHVVIESDPAARRTGLTPDERALLASHQDAELFLLGAEDRDALRDKVSKLLEFAGRLSMSELTDLAAALRTPVDAEARAAVVASRPAELERGLAAIAARLAAPGEDALIDPAGGVYVAGGTRRSGVASEAISRSVRIGFLFPGQGSPSHLDGGAWRRRFEFARMRWDALALPAGVDGRNTRIAQPAIAAASLVALRALRDAGVEACAGLGHSLGELTAFHWAGAYDDETLLRIAGARGRAMSELGSATGAMASLSTDAATAAALVEGTGVVLSGFNAPRQTVISGEAGAVAGIVERARARGIAGVRLPVSHAFHSPLVAAAAQALDSHLAHEVIAPLERRVHSTIKGRVLTVADDPRALLLEQVIAPVRFVAALEAAGRDVDLWIEVGPGAVLTGLVRSQAETPAIALDAGGASVAGLLHALGAAWTLGAPVRAAALFEGRFARPFDLDWRPRFLANPCESAPRYEDEGASDGTRERVLDGFDALESHGTAGAHENGRAAIAPATTAIELVRALVAARVELPPSAVADDHGLLRDLHLNSIVVGQIAGEAARALGLAPPADPTAWAGATVAELARALEELEDTGAPRAARAPESTPDGLDLWVRAFEVRYVEQKRPARALPSGPARWRVFAAPGDPLAVVVERELAQAGAGRGVVVCLPAEADERCASLLLDATRALWPERDGGVFLVVEHEGGGGGAYARTLRLETQDTAVSVVSVPEGDARAASWIASEALGAGGYSEAHYDRDGVRREPRLVLIDGNRFGAVAPHGTATRGGAAANGDIGVRGAASAVEPTRDHTAHVVASGTSVNGSFSSNGHSPPLGPGDVLLVTGGGKGIAAECALDLARWTGARLAILGRSRPDADAALAANLARFAAAGITYRYESADVCDADAVRTAMRAVEAELGTITAVLHGAGANEPRPLAALDESTFAATLAPKLAGLRNVIGALDPSRLVMLVGFGSIIARVGVPGEADYAVANEWQTRWIERFQRAHPGCRCRSIEWSVWSGTGMGERLGRIERLRQAGVSAITPEIGVAMLRRLVGERGGPVAVVVSGRFGAPPTLGFDRREMPLLRFLERVRVDVPGVELIADAELSLESDPYLADHDWNGTRLFPAVMGLEAMAQAARALTGIEAVPQFESLRFERPVTLDGHGRRAIRVLALARESGAIEVAIRSAESDFQVDHFRGVCRFVAAETANSGGAGQAIERETVAIAPERDLYGRVLFQSGRFQRVQGYHRLRGRESVAQIGAAAKSPWFGPWIPAVAMLGDPGARDAALHSIQASIPHRTLLPVAVERIETGVLPSGSALVASAREQWSDGTRYRYDLDIADAAGQVIERWTGLELVAAGPTRYAGPWPSALLGAFLERRFSDAAPESDLRAVLQRNGGTDAAIRRVVGSDRVIVRRPDGKPEVAGEPAWHVSASDTELLTLAVAGRVAVGCDLEPVTRRTADEWQALLGPRLELARAIARASGDDEHAAGTRVWTALECLKKCGLPASAPLRVAGESDGGWLILEAGSSRIATYIAAMESGERIAIGLLAGAR